MSVPTIRQLVNVYELLLETLGREKIIEYLEGHAYSDRMVVAEESGDLLGVAFFWHVNDPYDIEEQDGYPGEDPGGRYLYFPYLYVRKDRRDGSVLKRLIHEAFIESPAARRMAFHRGLRLHVLRIIDGNETGRKTAVQAAPAESSIAV